MEVFIETDLLPCRYLVNVFVYPSEYGLVAPDREVDLDIHVAFHAGFPATTAQCLNGKTEAFDPVANPTISSLLFTSVTWLLAKLRSGFVTFYILPW